ncbi:hypothetical protein B0H19DRAFT_37180 [Mycena capillaripes]|nr:hypothetical protein B0H19DRAFT_37180 [Mycena capillaripes]
MLGPRSTDSCPSMPPSLQHQRSTKLLINRFESLSDHKRSAGRVSPTGAPLFPPTQSTESKKDKSPIRQSFRNLFAALKKSSGLHAGKSKLEATKNHQKNVPDTILSPEDPFTVSTKAFPVPQLAGSFFYLARSSETPAAPPRVLPVWTFCSAVLEGDTMYLTWPTNPSTHSVFLKHCTDVRSLTPDELDSEERALLPVKDLKVFRLLFDGRTEKLATGSSTERARWISAIWDVTLPGCFPAGQPDGKKANVIADHAQSGHSRSSTICVDRALPPIPEQLRYSTTSTASSTTVSPSIHPPTTPESCGPSIYSRPKSPSMAKLGHLSVVTQRRAQIEGNQHIHSAPTSPSPLHRYSSVRSLRVEIPHRDDATSPASPTSILESYGDTYSSMNGEASPSFGHVQEQHHSGSQDECLSPHHAPSSAAHDSLLTDIHNIVSGVARRTEETENNLNLIQNQLRQSSRPELDSTAVTRALRDIDGRLQSDLPYIMKLLAQIQACQSAIESKEIPSQSVQAPSNSDLDKLNQILELLREDSLQRSVQTQQQTESVRYLNELNSWLEAFVSGGTAQIQVVAAGVDKLCQELGCSPEKGNIIAEIRQLIVDGQVKDQTTALQGSINNLAALITSESRNCFTAQSIATLIDQQRQDQEALLRALTAELSNEIRGERLRFVDAMKEATAINVQMHVEELKKELAREVRADLFAYYSQQKPPYVARPGTAPPPRALPNPRYGAYP